MASLEEIYAKEVFEARRAAIEYTRLLEHLPIELLEIKTVGIVIIRSIRAKLYKLAISKCREKLSDTLETQSTISTSSSSSSSSSLFAPNKTQTIPITEIKISSLSPSSSL